MALPDPFETLGVPRHLAARAYSEGDADRIRAMAEASYRGLSRILHPDRGGDPQAFAELTSARDEIVEDPLTVASFFIGGRGVAEAERREAFARAEAQRMRAANSRCTAAAGLLEFIDSSRVVPWLVGREAVLGTGFEGFAVGLVRLSECASTVKAAVWDQTQLAPGNLLEQADITSVDYSRAEAAWMTSVRVSRFDLRLSKLSVSEQREALDRRAASRRARQERRQSPDFKDEQPLVSKRLPIPFRAPFTATVIGTVPSEWVMERTTGDPAARRVGEGSAIGTGGAVRPALEWSEFRECWWAGELKAPSEEPGSYLALARSGPRGPVFCLVGPLYGLVAKAAKAATTGPSGKPAVPR
jgi:curved DNA-binding protein CbpA